MKHFIFKTKQIILFILRFFFSFLNDGEKCIICGKKTFVFPVCKNCIVKYFSIDESLNTPRCKICGRKLISTKETCSKCREEKILNSTDTVTPVFSYRLWNKELLYRWKIKEDRSISVLFAYFVHQVLKQLKYQIVVPVPPRKGKIQKKGWDQIDELCTYLEKVFGIKVLHILKRNSTEQQKKLNRKERLDTISSAYDMESEEKVFSELKCFNGIMPEEVCLIDDVCTTGATIECCADILKKNGIKIVNVITLFIGD